jgi:Essential protein Yae1, N terminal.
MSLGKVTLDPDDPFDKIVFLEDSLQQEGFHSGFQTGKKSGEEEGYKVGLNHGKELGKEIGFYKGFVMMSQELLSVESSKRQHILLEQLKKLLDKVNYDNPEDEKMEEIIAKIRTKFKQLTSLLKVPVNIEKGDSAMSF